MLGLSYDVTGDYPREENRIGYYDTLHPNLGIEAGKEYLHFVLFCCELVFPFFLLTDVRRKTSKRYDAKRFGPVTHLSDACRESNGATIIRYLHYL